MYLSKTTSQLDSPTGEADLVPTQVNVVVREDGRHLSEEFAEEGEGGVEGRVSRAERSVRRVSIVARRQKAWLSQTP